jgi:phosphomethylpyrimidine synthase
LERIMNAAIPNQAAQFTAAGAHVDEAAVQPLPNSRKIYVEGSQPDIRVPMREISQADTPLMFSGEPGQSGAPVRSEPNPPIFVYDCSGPYSDPAAKIDIRTGLPALRNRWIEARGDTEVLSDLSSEYGRQQAANPALAAMRFPGLHRTPRRAKAGMNVTQMHYARQGIVTPEMEFVAIRENNNRAAYLESLKASGPQGAKLAALMNRQHPGQNFGASLHNEITPEFVRD